MKLKKVLSVVLICVMLASTVLIGVTAADTISLPFDDVPNKWYKNAVTTVYNEGIMTGKSDTKFDPTAKITRAEVVTAFARIACTNIDGYGDSLGFTDTKTGKWYSDSVGWAAENGIVKGRGDGRFSPNDKITRAELASIIVNFVGYMELKLPTNAKVDKFADASTFAKWMKTPVEEVRRTGLMQGDSAGKFNPKGDASRAEIAQVITNLLPRAGRTVVVENGKSDYVIVINEENAGALSAAQRLSYQIKYLTGADVAIVDDSVKAAAKEIVIGGARDSSADTAALVKSGYEITVKGEKVYVDAAEADGLYRGAVRFALACISSDDMRFTAKTAARDLHEYPVKSLKINGNDISKYTIYYPANASKNTLTAVDDLVKYIEMACGVTLSKSTENPGKFGIIVDETTVEVKDSVNKNNDNFTVRSEGNSIRLMGSADRAAAYACYDFLEKYVGCVFLTSKQDYIEPAEAIDIKGVDYTESPVFAIRDNYGNIPTLKFRDYAWSTANGIHTFAALAPDYCKQYDNQPCLLDEAVYEQMIENALKKLEAKPDSDLISFSMNDNTNWCTCEKCTAFMESVDNNRSEYVIRFVNRAAEAIEKAGYKDVLIHTFSYADAVQAPITKPRDNVIIQFCPIQACIAHPLTDDCNTGMYGEYIGKYMKDWAEVGCKMYLWTYHGNFSNCPVPHTDISSRTMLENSRFYADCGTIGWFGQIDNRNPDNLGDFGALRNYLLSKTMWDPYMTEDEFDAYVVKFMKGYYGKDWKLIYEAMETYLAGDPGHHKLWAPVEERMIYFLYKLDTEYFVNLFEKAQISAESETIWKNIDRNQLSFDMMDVSVKWRKLYKSGTDADIAKAQSLAKWFQDKLLVYVVSYGSESNMYPSMKEGEFVDPSNWRGLLEHNAEVQQYWNKIDLIPVDYPDYPTDLLPYIPYAK